MTSFYFNVTDYIQNRLKYDKNEENYSVLYQNSTIFRVLVSVIWDPSPVDVWNVRISIDYMLRFITSVSSGVGYILVVLWARFGYNSHFFTIEDFPSSQFNKSLVFVAVGTALEVIVYFVMEQCLTRGLHLKMVRYWRVLIKHRPLYITFFILALQHVMTDVLIAKLIISF